MDFLFLLSLNAGEQFASDLLHGFWILRKKQRRNSDSFRKKVVLLHRPQGGARHFPPVEGLERNNQGHFWQVLRHFIEILVRGRPGKSYYSKERWGFGDSISKKTISLQLIVFSFVWIDNIDFR